MTGIGHTKRVVLYDTLLKDFTPAETRLVVAHELGHVRYRDVPHGLLWLLLVAPFGMLAVARAGASGWPGPADRRRARRRCSRSRSSRRRSRRSPTSSRARVERRADAFALELTDEPDAMIAFQRRITLQNVARPRPAALGHVPARHPPADDGADRPGA